MHREELVQEVKLRCVGEHSGVFRVGLGDQRGSESSLAGC